MDAMPYKSYTELIPKNDASPWMRCHTKLIPKNDASHFLRQLKNPQSLSYSSQFLEAHSRNNSCKEVLSLIIVTLRVNSIVNSRLY